jgi:hypothetical protein
MTYQAWDHRRPPRRGRRTLIATSDGGERVPVSLDLRRADLYRMLDQFARAPAQERADLVREFEQAWQDYKEATTRRG